MFAHSAVTAADGLSRNTHIHENGQSKGPLKNIGVTGVIGVRVWVKGVLENIGVIGVIGVIDVRGQGGPRKHRRHRCHRCQGLGGC
jgi:hypothetical protein